MARRRRSCYYQDNRWFVLARLLVRSVETYERLGIANGCRISATSKDWPGASLVSASGAVISAKPAPTRQFKPNMPRQLNAAKQGKAHISSFRPV